MGAEAKRRAVVGIFAHVDAGKTTLNEALLYRAGVVRKLGSVDAGDSHLDYHALEQKRGITIFAKQTTIERCGVELTLLDTPGHVDFAAEAERVMDVLDYAILLVNANGGIQGHALTLWSLLQHRDVPTVLFANKMDFARVTCEEFLADARQQLSGDCIDFSGLRVSAEAVPVRAEVPPKLAEACAATDERALEEYFETEALGLDTMRRLVRQRKVFPCFFGSALKQVGIDELIDGIAALVEERDWPAEFGARVFKVSRDLAGTRLTWVKVTGGSLSARQVVGGVDGRGSWSEKVDQIRRYSGSRFEALPCVEAGQTCAVTGLSRTQAGRGLGIEGSSASDDGRRPLMAPAFASSIRPVGADMTRLHAALNELTDEEPLLDVRWNERLHELQVQLMGTIQQEVLQDTLHDRFGLDVTFGPSGVLYRETIESPVTGIGHFEPLRHYAEVHLLLEPLPAGSGLRFGTRCHTDELDLNWQRLIMTNAMEREHAGVLTGAPLTDVRITLIAGRVHDKHTEGGDFRQATYRAVRQALMQADSVLLEPWQSFRLRVPIDLVGRAIADLQQMSARMDPPRTEGDYALICGAVPAKEMRDYPVKLASYTHGKGSLSLQSTGYEPCHDAEAVIAEAAYDPEADLANTPDSVFCSHGAGRTVKWGDVASHAHVTADPAAFTEWREATPEFFGRR